MEELADSLCHLLESKGCSPMFELHGPLRVNGGEYTLTLPVSLSFQGCSRFVSNSIVEVFRQAIEEVEREDFATRYGAAKSRYQDFGGRD